MYLARLSSPAMPASVASTNAASIATCSQADTIVELGSGTSDKTTLLLDAFTARGQLARFVPFDVSEATLRDAAVRHPSGEHPHFDGAHAMLTRRPDQRQQSAPRTCAAGGPHSQPARRSN